jgi:hydrogenase expression/formation protein HypC
MCLGIPGEILSIREENELSVGVVKFGGIKRDVCLACIPDAAVGDFVLVHVGFAIARIDREEAERAYRTLEELGFLAELDDAAGAEGAGGPPAEGAS